MQCCKLGALCYRWHLGQHSEQQNTCGRVRSGIPTRSKWPNCQDFQLPLPAEIGKSLLRCPVQQCKSFNPVYCMPACKLSRCFKRTCTQANRALLDSRHTQNIKRTSFFYHLDHILSCTGEGDHKHLKTLILIQMKLLCRLLLNSMCSEVSA